MSDDQKPIEPVPGDPGEAPPPADALDQHARNVGALIGEDPGYRRMARRMLERFGDAAPSE